MAYSGRSRFRARRVGKTGSDDGGPEAAGGDEPPVAKGPSPSRKPAPRRADEPTRSPLLSASPSEGEAAREVGTRPSSLAEFTGQEASKANLAVFVAAARARGEAMDHVLLVGPPGLGKTTMAQILARELGSNFRSTSGPVIAKPGDLAAQLTALEDRDVLFIDEIHRLPTTIEEILYPAMEDFQLDLMVGEGPGARSVKIDLARFTLIGATTRAGLLSRPLHDRFGIPIRMRFYEPAELAAIVGRAAAILGIGITAGGAEAIAGRSRGTPRIANRLLRRVRDFASDAGGGEITAEGAEDALARLEVDPAGLDSNDLRYLSTMLRSFGGGPVGIETMAAAISEPSDSIEDVIEPYLIQAGFLQRTPRGRMLTRNALDHLASQHGMEAPAPRPPGEGVGR